MAAYKRCIYKCVFTKTFLDVLSHTISKFSKTILEEKGYHQSIINCWLPLSVSAQNVLFPHFLLSFHPLLPASLFL